MGGRRPGLGLSLEEAPVLGIGEVRLVQQPDRPGTALQERRGRQPKEAPPIDVPQLAANVLGPKPQMLVSDGPGARELGPEGR